jgi:hypothetical protein
MTTFTVFNSFKEAMPEKLHNLGSDTLKWMLSNTAPSLSNTVKANITEIAAGSGYTAGGATVTVSSSSQTGGTYSLVIGTTTFTAAGGTIGPFRYVVLYNDTATNDELIGYLDYGTAYTLPDTQSFPINAGTVLQIA